MSIKIGVNASGAMWHMPLSGPGGDLVRMVQGLVPALIRVPGGTLGNYARMSSAGAQNYGHAIMGLVENLDMQEYDVNDGRYYNRYGNLSSGFMDHYLKLCSEVGAEPLWVCNLDYWTDTLRAVGVTGMAGQRFAGVELGNEQWLLKYGRTAEWYVERCALVKGGLRDSGYLGPVGMCLKVGGGKRLAEWNRAVVESGIADAYVVHLYQDEEVSLVSLVNQMYAMVDGLELGSAPLWATEVGSQRAVIEWMDMGAGYGLLKALANVKILCMHNLLGDGDHAMIRESRGWLGGNRYTLTRTGREMKKLFIG